MTTHFYNNQQVVFEVSSFFNRTTSKENIQAMEDCMGWCISYEQLNRLFHDLPEFREFGRSILVKGFAALKTRMISMIIETAEQRYADLLNTNPEIFQHAPLKYIAAYLGITDSSLSRIRKDYAKKQYVFFLSCHMASQFTISFIFFVQELINYSNASRLLLVIKAISHELQWYHCVPLK